MEDDRSDRRAEAAAAGASDVADSVGRRPRRGQGETAKKKLNALRAAAVG